MESETNYTNKLFCQSRQSVVVAQLAEQSLPTPKVSVLNPVISKFCIEHFTFNCIEKPK